MSESGLQEMDEPKGVGRVMLLAGFSAFGVFALIIALTVFASHRGALKIKEKIELEPLAISYEGITEADYQVSRKKIEQFLSNARKVSKLELILDAKDLNALLAYEPLISFAQNRFHATIKDKMISGPLSVFVPESMRDGEKKYFNCQANFEVKLKKGKLWFVFKDMQHKSGEMDLQIIHAWQERNMFELLAYNEKYAKDFDPVIIALKKVKYIEITDENTIIIRNWEEKAKTKLAK